MNFGYGDILDYLMSIHRSDLNLAIRFDMRYMIEKTFKSATPVEMTMMVLDFVLNYEGPSDSAVMRSVPAYIEKGVLGASVCGVPLAEYANRTHKPEVIALFTGVAVPLNGSSTDESTVARVIEMFKVKLKDESDDSMTNLARAWSFAQRTCFDDQTPDGPRPKM